MIIAITGASQNDKRDSFNYMIGIIKVLMAFEVILCHYWTAGDTNSILLDPFIKLRLKAVPVFIVTSFFYLGLKLLRAPVHDFYKSRIQRLLIPYVGWAIVYYLVFCVCENVFSGPFAGSVTLKSLGWQLLLGACWELCPQLWYQADLIIITVLVLALFVKLKRITAYRVCFCLSMIALILQYTGINYKAFGELPIESKYTIGRICEMLPLSFAGLVLAVSVNQITKEPTFSQARQRWIAFGSLLMVIFIYRFKVFAGVELNFAYAGFDSICLAIGIVLFGIMMPLSNLPGIIKRIILFLSRFTFGVFCIHWAVGKYMMEIMKQHDIIAGTFPQCVAIMGISYVILWLFSLLPLRCVQYLVE